MGYYKWSESVSNLLVSEQCLFGLWCPDQSWAVVLASYSLTCLLSQSCHWSACDPLFYVHHPMSQLTRCVPAPGSLSTVCSAPCLRPQSRLRAGAGAETRDIMSWQLATAGTRQTTVYKADPRPPSTQMARLLWRSDDLMLLVLSRFKNFIDMEEV